MVSRIFRKIKFLSLRNKIQAYERFIKTNGDTQLVESMLARNKEKLSRDYEYYIQNVSRADMAASLELAAFLLSICEVNKYKKLVDFGSGLSSFVLRAYAKQNPDVQVYSVDDDAAWLQKTKLYLQQHQLDVNNMLTLDAFLTMNPSGFDCILHDLNFVEVRVNYVERIVKMASPGGLIILDDVHKPDYLFQVLQILESSNVDVYDLKPATLDRFGRFSIAAVRKG